MVAYNPLFHGRWTLQRFSSTIVSDIWPEILLFSLFSTMITLISEKTNHNLALNNQLLTVFGVVLGLVISFRTSSAYERFQDGSKMWTNIITASRTLAQQIWIHVPIDREQPNGKDKKETILEVVIEKKTMINMIHAFTVSVKHLLRGEPGVYYEDLYPLVCFLPRYASTAHISADILPLWYDHDETQDNREQMFSGCATVANAYLNNQPSPSHKAEANNALKQQRKLEKPSITDAEAKPKLKPSQMPPETTIYDYMPILRLCRWIVLTVLMRRKQAPQPKRKPKRIAYSVVVESNVPLEIFLTLSSYSAFLMRNSYVQLAVASGITNNLAILHDSLSNLERICNNPLPFAYQAHLRMCLWLYLLLLPFQVLGSFGYFTIPATALVSLLLIGFLEIGQEIENPFNYGLNDLDLDGFCDLIRRELLEITAQTHSEPSAFIFDTLNQPFAPSDRRTAKDLSDLPNAEYTAQENGGPKGMDGIGHTLIHNWRQVEKLTRE